MTFSIKYENVFYEIFISEYGVAMDMNMSCTIFCAASAATCNVIRYTTVAALTTGV